MTPRRISVVASEILGVSGTGGPGTADTFLAIALARRGHDVELLVAPGRDVARLEPEWQARYAAAGVRVRPLDDDGSIRPSFLAPAARVYDALREDPPDVVVADDWRALPYGALSARRLGEAFLGTAFVLYSHGPARVFAAAARKVPDTVERFGEEVAQRACAALADAVASPSAWLLEWLRRHRWALPARAQVIQNLWQSTALGEPLEPVPAGAVRRIAFFGHLREGKGLRVFVEALQKIDPELLEDAEIVFVGHTRRWSPADITEMLGARVTQRVAVRFETALGRAGAIEELRRPGTLAVMPSLLENSPYAVAECLEHGIPFIAADVGGTPELVAEVDRARVLVPPTAEAFAHAVARSLAADIVEPAVPARSPEESLADWLALMEEIRPAVRPVAAAGDAVLWSEAGVVADDALHPTLERALAASGADAVTCAVRTAQGRRLFLGDPGPLGLIENHYGVVGLVRRERAGAVEPGDSAWVSFARLATSGARILSLPEPLATYAERQPTGVERLAVLEAFEHAAPETLRELPQLTATMAAAGARTDGAHAAPRSRLRRLLRLGSS
jgi:glycosyltransferase involved in cell wall biosynthesis